MAPDAKASLANAWLPTFTPKDYAVFFAAGGSCALLTHGGMTPIDRIKTSIQLQPKGSNLGFLSMGRKIIAEEGPKGLMTGFGPTAVGYLIQGGSKFAGFEYFKLRFAKAAGSKEQAEKYRSAIYIGGSAAAEFIASTFLTPLEAARIRLVSERGYAKGLVGAVTRMASEGGFREFYAGYVPILLKQVPYTIAQFSVNEAMHEVATKVTTSTQRESWGRAGEIGIQLGCSTVSGIAAAVVSHPADTLLSQINKGGGGPGSATTKLVRLAREAGFGGLWSGLGTRIGFTVVLVMGQFAIYDEIKRSLGAAPPVTIHKVDKETK